MCAGLGCWKHTIEWDAAELSWKCLIDLRLSVPCRFTPQRHPCCGPGGRSDLCSAGRSNLVRVQEGCFLFSGPPHLRQRLLQANQHAVVRVGWKCAHHRHKWILRTIAWEETSFSLLSLRLSAHHFTIRDRNAVRRCHAAVPTPQDSDEVTTTQLSLSSWEVVWRIPFVSFLFWFKGLFQHFLQICLLL